MLTASTRRSLVLLVLLAGTGGTDAQGSDEAGGGHTGYLLAKQSVELDPPFSGRLQSVEVRTGDVVRRGDLIATLDDRAKQQEKARAIADLDEVRASLSQAEIRVEMARENHARRSKLVVELSEEERKRALEDLKIAEAELSVARARIKQKEAQLRQLEEQLNQARLLAPFDGTVARRYHDPGKVVGPGTPVVRLISNEGLWVRFAVPLEEAGDLAVDGRILVYVPSLEFALTGAISQISTEVDPGSGMIHCEATVEMPRAWDGPALPNRAVQVSLASR